MPSKTEEYLALAQRTANGLTRYWESWTDYLTTASRLYKYPFADQLMIYAQRPDATACASFDIWNNIKSPFCFYNHLSKSKTYDARKESQTAVFLGEVSAIHTTVFQIFTALISPI